jgi:ribonuclease-3
MSNERLEFLGDSVLNMVVSHALYERNPEYNEGELTKLKSSLVSKSSTAIAGHRAGIDKFILLSRSEEEAGGRNRTSIVADTYEAVIGALYLDGGLEEAEKFIQRTILDDVKGIIEKSFENYKSLLLEYTQSRKLGYPTYRTVTEEGPDHDKVFTVEVYVMGRSCGMGKGKSKKIAQQIAAKECFQKLQQQNNKDYRENAE